MIPVRLTLQNFMAYRDSEALDFNDIHVACLSGENGAGKSSLLDAITWSLWGKARVSARDNDSLVHLGETEMEVEFSFALAEQTYRVLRRRNLTGRGKSELHFHIADAGGWRTLTEGTITQTQKKIDRLLRLDYDTFINSAFLLQGRADEFTNKTARERKQILADILGLGIYDEYEMRTRDQVRYYQQEIRIIEGQIEQIEAELARETDYQTELERSRAQAADLKRALEQTEGRLIELRQQAQTLTYQQEQLDDLQTRLGQAQTDLSDLAQTIATGEKKLAVYRDTLTQAEAINAGHQAMQQAQAEVDDWSQRLTQSGPLIENKHRLETAVNQARTKLETEIQHTQARLSELQPKVAGIETLQGQANQLAAELTGLQALADEQVENRQRLEALTEEAADLRAKNEQLKGEMDQINNRLTQLKAAESVCPVCTQPLSDSHRQQVAATFQAEGTERGDVFRANRGRQQEIEAALKKLRGGQKKADRELKQLPKQQAQLATCQQSLTEAEAARAQLQTMEKQLAERQQQLAEQQFEVEAVAELAEVQAELAGLGYQAQAHQQARQRLESLAHFAEDHRRLADAQTRLAEEEPRLAQDQARHERLLKQTEADREQIAGLKEKTAALPQVTAELGRASRELDQLQREERLARSAVGAAEQKLNHIAQQAKARGSKEEKLLELKETMGLYQELRTAFGKNGVQALLIENAIPELEDEANTILSQMTDGRMHLQFLTQRETKTGQNLVETLEIRIADEIGSRNYELYSGGEAFRVNFAIRIALSKLLARRSGAKLQTLVIDEGFGSQDAQGRERLVESIRKIQAEFEKIIVITHIDELKDIFPTRITVQKTPTGSTILMA